MWETSNWLQTRITRAFKALSGHRNAPDSGYNITAMLQNPAEKGPGYRRSGIRKILADLNEDQAKYAGQQEWEDYIRPRRHAVEQLMRLNGFTLDEVIDQRWWPTLSQYLGQKPADRTLAENQDFLRIFTFRHWREYSALSHGDCEGFMGFIGPIPAGSYYISDLMPGSERPKIEASYGQFCQLILGARPRCCCA